MDLTLLLTVILPAVLKMLEDCNKGGEYKVVLRARLLNPGPVERWALRTALSRNGLRGDKLRDAVQNGIEWLHNADEDDIDTLLEDAKIGK
jgi:hypothetical protein